MIFNFGFHVSVETMGTGAELLRGCQWAQKRVASGTDSNDYACVARNEGAIEFGSLNGNG